MSCDRPGASSLRHADVGSAHMLSRGSNFLGDEQVSQQQGCSVAVVPLRALREPSGVVVH